MSTRRLGTRREEAALCPACGSRRGVPIVYGYPGPELSKAAENGLVVLGGCCVSEANPTRACLGCGHCWGHLPIR